jgi:hypothetical protein
MMKCLMVVLNHPRIPIPHDPDPSAKQLPCPPPGININEPGCKVHPRQETYACQTAKPYNILGSYDVFTNENTIFYWNKLLYVVENIPCQYWEHAGIWDPSYGNRSYARIRELISGRVVSNISSSAGFGFLSAFPDYDRKTVWLFGVEANRCQGTATTR